jgi:electron transfer flavoprotein alpha subunit
MARALLICLQPTDAQPLASFARSIGAEFDAVVAGGECLPVGAGRIWLAGPEFPVADAAATALRVVAQGYEYVAAVSSMASKDLLARLAGLLDAAMVTDVVRTVNPTTFERPIVAGTLIETVEVLAAPAVYTIRPAGYPKADASPNGEVLTLEASPSLAKRVNASAKSGGRPELTQAKVVVSGGRPLKDAETYERLIGGLADKLGGAAGATRAAVDSGIAPTESQVGQTGKIVAPDLYIAAGISGSTQHMAGIKDSKIIVAINKDPDAPIFEFADLGLVADLFEAIPQLLNEVKPS